MSALDIFGEDANTFTTYAVELRFRNLVVGGIPSDRSVIESWIRARMDLGDIAIRELVEKMAAERGTMSTTDAIDAVLDSELAPSVNGFLRNPQGVPCIEGRIVKAGIKEWMNSSFPGTDWPGKSTNTKTKGLRKGLMRYGAEAIYVPEILIPLEDADGGIVVQERIKHVQTPQGPRSSINRVEVLKTPRVRFSVCVRDDFLPSAAWGRIWASGEAIGLGSDRGRSDGMFSLEQWKQV